MKLIGLTLLLAQTAGADEIYEDFRGQQVNAAVFRHDSPDAFNLIKSEPEGLRITLPAQGIARPIGLVLVSRLKGDFEVTARYEFLHLDPPTGGFGAGFSVYVRTNSPAQEGVEFFHFVRPHGDEAYGLSALATTPDGRRGGIPEAVTEDIAANARSGRLRAARVGADIVLSAAREDSDDFKALYRINLGTADVTTLRLAATPGNAPNPVDLRLLDFRLRQKGIVLPTGSLLETEKGFRLFLLLALLLAVLLCAFLAWYYRRRGKKTSTVTVPER